LSHYDILTNSFLPVKHETLEVVIVVSRVQIAQRARTFGAYLWGKFLVKDL
jgi:hypothetical protein